MCSRFDYMAILANDMSSIEQNFVVKAQILAKLSDQFTELEAEINFHFLAPVIEEPEEPQPEDAQTEAPEVEVPIIQEEEEEEIILPEYLRFAPKFTKNLKKVYLLVLEPNASKQDVIHRV